MDIRTLALLLGAFIISLSLTQLYRTAAIALRIVAEPNERSAHQQITPTGAGIGFVTVSGLAILLYSSQIADNLSPQLLVLLPVFVVAVLGFVDDLRDLSWQIRLGVQGLCAVAVMLMLDFPELPVAHHAVDLGLLGEALGLFCLVALLNFYNFMDGIDGIAASEGVFVLCAAALLSTMLGVTSVFLIPALAVAACVCGFLVLNRPLAKVFMGDIGAGFLGLLFGVFILREALIPVWTWLILLGYFIVDAGVTIIHRLWRGERIQDAHSEHAYQHLNRRVGSWKTLGLMHLINLFWLFPLAWLSALYPAYGLFLLVLALLPLGTLCFYCGAGWPRSREPVT